MLWSLILAPSGNLRLVEEHGASSQDGTSSPLDRIAAAFHQDATAGLFSLAAQSVSGGLPPVPAYWRDFASRYLTDRCHSPGGAGALEPVPPLSDADIARMILGMPPMAGGEYLTPEVIGRLWESLDAWVRREAGSCDGGLEALLKARALQEFAGERNRKALVHLLTPSHEIDAIAADSSRIAGADMVLTTYGMLPRQPWLESVDWRLVVLDEAQAIKNPSTRQIRAVKKLKARARVALTGTPVENRLSDLWSLFDFLCPGLLGTAADSRISSKPSSTATVCAMRHSGTSSARTSSEG